MRAWIALWWMGCCAITLTALSTVLHKDDGVAAVGRPQPLILIRA
ncbi:MAG: hypothetical protein R2795_16930 [Saprospiraceae bacterium]